MAVTEESGYSKVFALFMPWMLTDAHRDNKSNCNCFQYDTRGEGFLSVIVKGS
jgi:hypothetical protein